MTGDDIIVQLGLQANTQDLDIIMSEVGKRLNKKFNLNINYNDIDEVLKALEKYNVKMDSFEKITNTADGSVQKVNIQLKEMNGTIHELTLNLEKLKQGDFESTTEKTKISLQNTNQMLDLQIKQIKEYYDVLYKLKFQELSSSEGSNAQQYYAQRYKDEEAALNSLLKTLNAYNNEQLRNVIGTGSERISNLEEETIAKRKDIEVLENQKKAYADVTNAINTYITAYSKYQKAKSSTDTKVTDLRAEELSQSLQNLKTQGVEISGLDTLEAKFTDIGSAIAKDSNYAEKFSIDLQEASAKVSDMLKAEHEDSLNKQLKEAISTMQEYYRLQVEVRKLDTAKSSGEYYDKVVSNYNKLSNEVKNFSSEITQNKQYIDAETEANNKATLSMAKLQNNVERTGTSFGTFSKKLVTVAQNVLVYQLSWRALNQIDTILENSIRKIVELDEAMVNIRMVTGQTDEQTQQLMGAYADLAYQFGSTTKNVSDASIEILRMGKNEQETTQILTASTILSRLGMIGSAEATQLMTSTLNGFNISAEDSLSVVDKLVSLDLKYATSASEVATALKYVAASAGMAGISLDEMSAMITVVSDKSRRAPESIGQSFRSMLARLQNIKLGKFIDDDTQESLNDVESTLKKMGIALRSDENTWRDASEVFDEIGTNWQKFTDIEKSSIATALGGTRQRENLIITFENWNEVLQATNVALESNGTATKKYEVYMSGFDAKINQFIATWEKLINNLKLSGLLKGFVDLGTGAVKTLDILINKFKALWAVAILFTSVGVNAGITTWLEKIGSLTQKTGGNGLSGLFDFSQQNAALLQKALFDVNNLSTKIKQVNGKDMLVAFNKTTQEVLKNSEGVEIMADNFGDLAKQVQDSVKPLTSFQKALVGIQTAASIIGTIATVVTAVMTVISLVVSVVESYKQAQIEAAKAAGQFSEEIDNNIKSLENYKKQITDINKALSDETLTTEQSRSKREELLSIQKTLIEQYGSEASAIQFLGQTAEETTKSFDSMAKSQYESLLTNSETLKARQSAKQYLYEQQSFEIPLSMSNDTDVNKFIEDYTKKIKPSMSKFVQTYKDRLIEITANNIYAKFSRKEFVDFLEDLNIALQEWGKETGNNVDNAVIKIGDKLAFIKNETYTASIDALSGVGEATANVESAYTEMTKNVKSSISSLDDAIASGDQKNIENATKIALDAQRKAINNAIDSPLVYEYYESLLTPYQAYINKVEAKTKIQTDRFTNDIAKTIKGVKYDDIFKNDTLFTNFNKLKESLSGLISETDGAQELVDILSELGYIEMPTDLSFDYISELNSYSTILTDAQEKLNLIDKAQKEVSESGYITAQTQKDVNESFGETANLIELQNDKLVLNTKKAKDYSKEIITSKLEELNTLKIAYEKNSMQNTEEYNSIIKLISAYQSLSQTVSSSSNQMLYSYSDINTALDDLQSAYNTLSDAMKEYAETGYYTLDTLQSIIALSPKYLSLLSDENGNINLTTESLKKLTAARIKDLTYRKKQDIIDTISSLETKKEQIEYAAEVYGNQEQMSDEDLIASAGIKIPVLADVIKKTFAALNSAEETALSGVGTEDFFKGSSSKNKIDDVLSNSEFYTQQLEDILKPLDNINQDIDDIQYNIDKATMLNNLEDVTKYTQDLIDKKKEQKTLLENILQETQSKIKEINETFSEFGNVPMTKTGIEKFKQDIDNKITNLNNQKNKLGSDADTTAIDKRIQDLQQSKTLFEEYASALESAKNQEIDIKKQISDISTSLIQTELDKYESEKNQLDKLRDLDLISENDYYKASIELTDRYFKDKEEFAFYYQQKMLENYENQKNIEENNIKTLERELELLKNKNTLLTSSFDESTSIINPSETSAGIDYWKFKEGNYDEQIAKQKEMIDIYKKMEEERRSYLVTNKRSFEDIFSDEIMIEIQNNITKLEDNIKAVYKTAYDDKIKSEEKYIEQRNLYNNWGTDSEINTLKRMIDYTDEYYKERKLSDEEYYNERTSLMSKYVSAQKEELEKTKKLQEDNLKTQEDALNDIIEATIKLITKEKELEKERHQQRIDDFEKEAEKRKEALDEESAASDYNKELKEKEKTVSTLEKKLAALRLDTSGKSAATIKSTEEELAEAREDLEDYQYKNSIDKQKEAIDDEVDLFTEKEQKQIDIIDDYLNKEGQIRADAINRIQNQWSSLYTDLINWNRIYGTGVDSDITSAWASAQSALQSYNSAQMDVLGTLQNIAALQKTLSDTTITGTYDYTNMVSPNKPTQEDTYNNTLQQMQINSLKWSRATTNEEKQKYADENQVLGRSIGLYYNKAEGRWYKDLELKVPAYSSGGYIAREQIAQLHSNEVVLNNKQAANTLKKLSINSSSPARDLYKLSNDVLPLRNNGTESLNYGDIMPITVQGNLDKSVLPDLSKLADKVMETINNTLRNTGTKRNVRGYSL